MFSCHCLIFWISTDLIFNLYTDIIYGKGFCWWFGYIHLGTSITATFIICFLSLMLHWWVKVIVPMVILAGFIFCESGNNKTSSSHYYLFIFNIILIIIIIMVLLLWPFILSLLFTLLLLLWIQFMPTLIYTDITLYCLANIRSLL